MKAEGGSSCNSPVASPCQSPEHVGALEAALDLLRRLPPQRIEENLLSLVQLLPSHTHDLLNTVDIPAQVRCCSTTSREYLACDYNRDGDSYRSPWSNEYEPALAEEASALKPSARLRSLEVMANEAFSTYRALYYEGGLSSVYVWEAPAPADTPAADCFTVAILIKKESEAAEGLRSGAWDAMHILEVQTVDRQARYKLTTTITLHLDTAVSRLDAFDLAGNITRQAEHTATLSADAADAPVEEHIPHMGRLVEEMESRMRSSLQEIYFGKTHDLINEIRPVLPAGYLRHQADLQKEIMGRLAGGMRAGLASASVASPTAAAAGRDQVQAEE